MSDPILRIHLLAQDGPIVSKRAGSPLPIGTDSTWHFACDETRAKTLGDFDRGTTEPWGVRCKACRKTAAYADVCKAKGIDPAVVPCPRPGRHVPQESEA